MKTRPGCLARQYGDQMICYACVPAQLARLETTASIILFSAKSDQAAIYIS